MVTLFKLLKSKSEKVGDYSLWYIIYGISYMVCNRWDLVDGIWLSPYQKSMYW